MTASLEFQNGVQNVALEPLHKPMAGAALGMRARLTKNVLVIHDVDTRTLLRGAAQSLQVMVGRDMLLGEIAHIEQMSSFRKELLQMADNMPEHLKVEQQQLMKRNIDQFNKLFREITLNTGIVGNGRVGFKEEYMHTDHSDDMLHAYKKRLDSNDDTQKTMDAFTVTAQQIITIYVETGCIENAGDLALSKIVETMENSKKAQIEKERWLIGLDLFTNMDETKNKLKGKLSSSSEEFNLALVELTEKLLYPCTAAWAKRCLETQ